MSARNAKSHLAELTTDERLAALARLGLKRDPFAPSLSGEWFFSGAGRGACLQKLRHLARYGQPLILVTGEQGTGKSSLLRAFYEQAEAALMLCAWLDAAQHGNAHSFLRALADAHRLDFGAVTAPRDDLERFYWFAEGVRREGYACVVLVDNAERLDSELLALIAESAYRQRAGERVLVRFVLAGPATLVGEALDASPSPEPEQDAYRMALPALDAADVEEYLQHCLRLAGTARMPLEPAVLRRISRASGGRIEAVHRHALEALLAQVLSPSAAPRAWLFWLAGALVVALTASLLALVGADPGSERRARGRPDPVTTRGLAKSTSSQGEALRGRPWVLSRNPRHYALRLAETSSVDDARALVRAHPSLSPLAVLPGAVSEGAEDRYWVIYGDFASREAARRAREGLPDGLGADPGHVLRFQTIKQKLR